MSDWTKRKILVNKCLELSHNRYTDSMISSDLQKKIIQLVDCIPVCREAIKQRYYI